MRNLNFICGQRKVQLNLLIMQLQVQIQVSLAIRGGYVPEKFKTENNKTGIFGPN
jgi:hypothetical protein